MTTLNLDENNATYQIRAFKPGFIQINETVYTQSIMVAHTQLIDDWAPQSVEALSADALRPVLDIKPDVLLIGTGSTLTFLPVEIYGELINHGIGVEIMDTAAACRTYSALSSENRHVMAALIIR